MRQNEDMRKISAWVAIGAVPTIVGGIYGMNFEHMPELDSPAGYPIVLIATVVACFTCTGGSRSRAGSSRSGSGSGQHGRWSSERTVAPGPMPSSSRPPWGTSRAMR